MLMIDNQYAMLLTRGERLGATPSGFMRRFCPHGLTTQECINGYNRVEALNLLITGSNEELTRIYSKLSTLRDRMQTMSRLQKIGPMMKHKDRVWMVRQLGLQANDAYIELKQLIIQFEMQL